MSKKKINIAVIGATGYTGLDLILLLSLIFNTSIFLLPIDSFPSSFLHVKNH